MEHKKDNYFANSNNRQNGTLLSELCLKIAEIAALLADDIELSGLYQVAFGVAELINIYAAVIVGEIKRRIGVDIFQVINPFA